jgi:hypothetical protein
MKDNNITEDYAAFAELWAQVRQDLVQKAVYKATESQHYRLIVSSMVGHLAALSTGLKGEHYEEFVKHFHHIISLISKTVYSQALQDSVEMPNTTDEIRAYFPPNPDDAEYKSLYDLLYDLPYAREEADF